MLRLNTKTDEYAFFDDSVPFPTDSALIAAREKLEIVRHENDHLSNLLPDTENGFRAFGHVLRAYLGQQILMVIECVLEGNEHVLELNGHNGEKVRWASFHTLHKIDVLPQEVAGPMQQSLKWFRNRIAHPSSTCKVAEFYTRSLLLVETVRDYIQCIESHLETQSVLLANAVVEHIQRVEDQY